MPAAALLPVYLAVHLLLDWATFIPGFSPLGITPWNPTTGLAFGIALLRGPAWAVLLVIGPLASDLLVRQVELPLSIAAIEVALTGLAYFAGLVWLRRVVPPFDIGLNGVRDLLLLGAVATVATAIVAALYVGVLVAAGLLPAAGFAGSALRYWIGEAIGILVMTPFVLLLFTARRARPSLENILQALAVMAAILLVLGLGARYQTQLFYVLFLPIVWVAVRDGLEGVSVALVLMQVGIMVSLHLGRQDAVDVTDFQAVMLVLVGAGLTIGTLVRERQRDDVRLRLLQDQIARGVRLASIDRFSTAMAHEINQPLTAIANYSRAAVRALEAEPADTARARETAGKALEQVTRAAEVVRRLRNLITLGRAELTPQRIGQIVDESLALARPDLAQAGIRVEVEIAPGAPDVLADRLQIEQVLTNLLRNAAEAMHELAPERRRLTIEVGPVTQADGGAPVARGALPLVRVAVSDSGPGFPPGFRLQPNLPSPTSKATGLGIGLSLSAAIVEAHGGLLTISQPGAPTTVSFTLRPASGESHGPHE